MEEKRCLGCMKLKQEQVCEHCGFDETQSNASHQLPLGTILKEQYLIGRVLGQGGFGITYLGWDMYLDIPVAIKEYYPNGTVIRDTAVSMSVSNCSGDDGSRFQNNKERFLREAKTLARFSQLPEVVQVRNFFLSNNTAYIVMEYVEGITLKQYVQDRGGKLEIQEALSILGPVVETLCKIHKTGLVHRDISPDNIMMLPKGGAKLLDFGAVRDVGASDVNKALSRSTEAILKQGYAPIEQYLNRGALGAWTDVYALCATVYYCLTGEVPASAPERLLDGEDIQWKEMVPGLSANQVNALTHGMQIRAENRTGSMDQLYQELFAVPEPVKPTPSEDHHKKNTQKQKADKPYPSQQDKPVPLPVYAGPPIMRFRRNKRRKKGWLVVCLVLLVVFAFAFCGQETGEEGAIRSNPITNTVSGSCGSEASWSLNRDTGELVLKGTGRLPNYRTDDIFVHKDSPYPAWDAYKSEITSVTIQDGITYVGWCSFYGCENLTTVKLAPSVDRIGAYCFANSGVSELNFSEGLEVITEYAFANTKLTSVTLPESVTYLFDGCFAECEELRSVTLQKNVGFSYHFEDIVFGMADNPSKVVLYGYENTIVEDYARISGHQFVSMGRIDWSNSGSCGKNLTWYLDRNTGFLKIDGEGSMYDYAGQQNDWYSGATREQAPWARYSGTIKTVSIGDNVTELGEYAFAHLNYLTGVHWGKSLQVIPYHAFLNTGITTVILPDTVKTIESHAFNWCSKLTHVELPASLKKLQTHAFNACYQLEEFFVPGETTMETAWGGITPFNQGEEMDLPLGMTIYGLRNSNAEKFAAEYGFDFVAGYQGMKAVDEGQMGDKVWWMLCEDTLYIYGDGETWRYDLGDSDITGWAKRYYDQGKAFTKRADYYAHAGKIRNLVIMPGVDQLMNGLFVGLNNLEYVDFGTITHCYAHFGGCESLKEITFPESTRVIGGWILNYCNNLEKVTILNGSGGIEENVFRGSYHLKEIWFAGREYINQDLFGDGEFSVPPSVKFYVKKNSSAMRYAEKKNIPYEIWE